MLTDFHHADGRQVAIDISRAILVEPHESGEGTFLVIGYEGGTREMHIREPYEDVRYYCSESAGARLLRQMAEEAGQPFDRSDPFGRKGRPGILDELDGPV